MTEIKIIDNLHSRDINIPNQPFKLYGKMIPSLNKGIWDYEIVLFPENEVTEMTFPDENYDYEEMSGDCIFIGVWSKYMDLYDLKVNSQYRGQGIASRLMEKAAEIAENRGYRGIYTIGQDNNLSACKFYLKYGFKIGGFDNHVYNGTSQQGKADIFFYLDF